MESHTEQLEGTGPLGSGGALTDLEGFTVPYLHPVFIFSFDSLKIKHFHYPSLRVLWQAALSLCVYRQYICGTEGNITLNNTKLFC